MNEDPAWNNPATAIDDNGTLVLTYEFKDRMFKLTFGDTGLTMSMSELGVELRSMPFRNSPRNIMECLYWLRWGDKGKPAKGDAPAIITRKKQGLIFPGSN